MGAGPPRTDPAAQTRLHSVLTALVRACRIVIAETTPFIPDEAATLRRQLGAAAQVEPVGPAFAQLDAARPDPITDTS